MAKLSPEDVVKIREDHARIRDYVADLEPDDEGYLKPSEIDVRVAQMNGTSKTRVQEIIMGLAHAGVGGPIDHGRRTRRDLYQRERASLGETEARRRLALRSRNIDPAPKVERLVQRVTILDSQGRPTAGIVDLAPGETVRVELVPIGGQG